MKKKSFLMICVVVVWVLSLGVSSAADIKPFRGLADIPEIKNKRPIHVALEAGGVAEKQLALLKAFSDKTGVPVTHELMVMSLCYSKIMPELIGGTGAYDTVVTETTWSNEWDPYIYDVAELSKKYEPGGVEALKLDLAGISKTQLRCASTRDGRLKGIPYYTYDTFMFLRTDVLEHPTEKANFKAKYGYELAPPKKYKELYNLAEFFTRKKGDLLKGEPLKWNLYGVALMAGNYAHVQDELQGMVWGAEKRFMRPVRDSSGKIVKYSITKADADQLYFGLDFYHSLMKFASPGCENAYWDFVTMEFNEGRTICVPFLYVSLNQWATDVYKNIPGASMDLYPVVGEPRTGLGYVGNFYQGVAKASKNPEAGFWLMRYLGSQEGQREFTESGWPGIRTDIYMDPKYQAKEWWTRVGMKAKALLYSWEHDLTPQFLDTVYNYNSSAAGRIYEMTILPWHQSAVGIKTPLEAAKYTVQQTIDLQTKFGDAPVEVDPAVTKWLAEK
jgi:multiple sugar transport system substrate-binding protein